MIGGVNNIINTDECVPSMFQGHSIAAGIDKLFVYVSTGDHPAKPKDIGEYGFGLPFLTEGHNPETVLRLYYDMLCDRMAKDRKFLEAVADLARKTLICDEYKAGELCYAHILAHAANYAGHVLAGAFVHNRKNFDERMLNEDGEFICEYDVTTRHVHVLKMSI